MLADLETWVPKEAIEITLVLFLSFLTGLEREEHKAPGDRYAFGGVRTFPLIALVGYSMSILSRETRAPIVGGFVVVAAFLLLSYWHKLTASDHPGITSEMSALTTYLVGVLVHEGHLWIATALSVAGLLLLELKAAMEGLAERMPPAEILTFTKFLLLSAVILPVVPNHEFGALQINPFRSWLVVVAVSAVSYGSYVCQRLTAGRSGLLLTAVLGGAYSSTLTTIALAKRASSQERPHLFTGGIVLASGVMYLRLTVLLSLFSPELGRRLAPAFLTLAAVAGIVGTLWSRRADRGSTRASAKETVQNPLELGAAMTFGMLFLTMLVATKLVATYVGTAGIYALAGVMGVTDVDPFIMSMTQTVGAQTSTSIAAGAVVIAAASNNAVKGVYARLWADRDTGRQSLLFLMSLALLGLLPLLR